MEQGAIIQSLLGLVILAYGWIFTNMQGRIKFLENLKCDPSSCVVRFDKIERKQDDLTPMLGEIRETLAKINPLLDILMKDYEKRQK